MEEAVLLGKIRFQSGRLRLAVQEGGFPDGTAFSLVSSEGKEIPLEGKGGGRKANLTLPERLPEGDWHLSPRMRLSDGARRDILLLGQRRAMGEDICFPMGGDGQELILRVRPRSVYDGPLIWWRERFAFAIAPVLGRLGLHRRAWVVFEKFCGQAQDNGVAFFRYCQGELPPERRRRVFFILDSRSPAWPELSRAYGRQVVPFMSLKHMLLMMLSPLYVASESRYHGYLFRCVPGPVFREIRRGRHRIFFLQHGVTAMKRVDPVFGAKGYNPMDYFAATSDWEQRIITENFGYPAGRVPVTGFCRWDEWKDKRDPQRPYLLVFPTWRGYLDGRDGEFFRSSEYFRAYQELLNSPELGELLKEEGLELFFAIHPRLAALGQCLTSSLERVCLMPYDGQAIPELLMGASALVTDYSSLAYDARYLERPVALYRFDEERYEKETGSYVRGQELPGKVCGTLPELLAVLRGYAREGYACPCPPGLFAYRDGGACRRTAEFLLKEGF